MPDKNSFYVVIFSKNTETSYYSPSTFLRYIPCEIVVFDPLSQETLEQIAGLMMDEYKEPLADKGIKFTYAPAVLPVIVQMAQGQKSAARDLRHIIRREVEDKMASVLIDRPDLTISDMHVDVDAENKITVTPW